MKNAKGWFSIGKLKDKKNKPKEPKDKAKDRKLIKIRIKKKQLLKLF